MKIKTIIAGVVGTAILACATIVFNAPKAQAATSIGTAPGNYLFNSASLATKQLTNGVSVTNVIYPAGKELFLDVTVQMNAAGTSNLVCVLQKGDGITFDTTSTLATITTAGSGTTAVTACTNLTINAVKAVRCITSTTAISGVQVTNTTVTWSSK